jgi:hypothetical protein
MELQDLSNVERLKDATIYQEEAQQDVANLEEPVCHYCLLINIVRICNSRVNVLRPSLRKTLAKER